MLLCKVTLVDVNGIKVTQNVILNDLGQYNRFSLEVDWYLLQFTYLFATVCILQTLLSITKRFHI